MSDMNTEIALDGKNFVSTSEASRLSEFAPDYIGQLCRAGKLVCRRVGKSWFVEKESLLSYKALDLNHAPSKAKRLNGSAEEAAVPVDRAAALGEEGQRTTDIVTNIFDASVAPEIAAPAAREIPSPFRVPETVLRTAARRLLNAAAPEIISPALQLFGRRRRTRCSMRRARGKM